MRQLGHDLMPWQRLVADVGLELYQDGTPVYREVVVTVPRQSGKTLLALGWELHRALLWGGRQTIVYGGTDENASAKKMIRDQLPVLESSPLSSTVRRVNRAAGKQAIEFHGGSRIELYGRSESSVHGRTVDMAVGDEIWADVDDRREQALVPAMSTRRAAQYVVISTAGTDASTYFKRKVDAGRQAAQDGRTDGLAYFEWSAPDDAPADDPETWRACMPALGLTIDESVIRHAYATMSRNEFGRAFLNRWVGSAERVIPDAAWQAVGANVEPSGRLTFGVDIAPARTFASIVVVDDAGRCELGEYGAGTGWVAGRVLELAQKHRARVAIDPAGPAGTLLNELQSHRVDAVTVSGRDLAVASQSLYDAIGDGLISVRNTGPLFDALDHAVASARRRPVGDGWSWARSAANADISPLVALTVAYHVSRQQPATRRPRVVW